MQAATLMPTAAHPVRLARESSRPDISQCILGRSLDLHPIGTAASHCILIVDAIASLMVGTQSYFFIGSRFSETYPLLTLGL